MNQSIISSSILKRFLLIFTLLFTQQSFAGDCDPNDANCVQITGTPINGETPIVSVGFEEMDPMNGINLAPGVGGGSAESKETKAECKAKAAKKLSSCTAKINVQALALAAGCTALKIKKLILICVTGIGIIREYDLHTCRTDNVDANQECDKLP